MFFVVPDGALKYRITDWDDPENTGKDITKLFTVFGLLPLQIESDIPCLPRALASLPLVNWEVCLAVPATQGHQGILLTKSSAVFGYR